MPGLTGPGKNGGFWLNQKKIRNRQKGKKNDREKKKINSSFDFNSGSAG